MYQSLEFLRPNRLQFVIKDVDLAYVNAVRRIILSEIPNVGFYFDPHDIHRNDINIKTNTGVLHNEFLAHRISLIPLCFDENEIGTFDSSQYNFVLNKKNTTASVIHVTSKDIEVFDKEGNAVPSHVREKIFPASHVTKDHILITKLKPNLYDTQHGDEIDIECVASVNTAKTHSRWSPVSQCSLMNVVDQSAATHAFDEKIRGKELTASQKADMKSRFDALEVYRNYKRNKYDEPSEFLFTIETECRMRPTYLFFKALTILESKLEQFVRHIETNDENVVVQQLGNVDNLFQVAIKNEDHTLVNTLQSQILHHEIRLIKRTDAVLTYIGYYQPHPLDQLLYIKLKFKDDTKRDVDFVREFLTKATKKLIQDVHKLTIEWIEVSDLRKTDIKEVESFV